MAKTIFDDGQNPLSSENENTEVIQAQEGQTIELPSGEFVADAQIIKDGFDLVLESPSGETIVVEGYFTLDSAPNLQAPDGSVLTQELIESFAQSAGPAQYAQTMAMSDESPVGLVQEMSGEANVVRVDGSSEALSLGSPIYQGDVIETGSEGALNISFVDDSSFAVSEGARLAIDEYVFDPTTEGGTQNFSLLKGVFVFTSGLIGREDPDDVEIDTPVGSIGIRGTTIAGKIDPEGESQITVVEGAIVIKNGQGEVTLSEQYETVQLASYESVINNVGQLDSANINNDYGSARGVAPDFFVGVDDGIESNSENANEAEQDAEQEAAQDSTEESSDTNEADSETQQDDDTTAQGSDASSDTEGQQDTDQQLSDEVQGADKDNNNNDQESAGEQGQDAVNDFMNDLDGENAGNDGDGLLGDQINNDGPIGGFDPDAGGPDSGRSGANGGTNTGSNASSTENGGNDTDPNGITSTANTGNTGNIGGDTVGGTNDSPPPAPGTILGAQSQTIQALGGAGASGFGVSVISDGSGRYFVMDNTGNVYDQGGTVEKTDAIDFAIADDFDGDGSTDFLTINDNGVIDVENGTFNGPATQALDITDIGDINGDGYSDVGIVWDNGQYGIFDGTDTPTSGMTGSLASLANVESISTAGDFNNDGFDDYILSTYSTSTGDGTVVLKLDGSATVFTGVTSDDGDVPIMHIGDFGGFGQGISDIAIASTGDNALHFIYGGSSPDLDLSDGVSSTGFTIDLNSNIQIVSGGNIGDFNGDGFDDFAIVTRGNGGTSGHADITILHGGTDFASLYGTSTLNNAEFEALYTDGHATRLKYQIGHGDEYNFEITGTGDLNGDGFDDFLIGTPDAADGNGAASIVYGQDTGNTIGIDPNNGRAGANNNGDSLIGNAGDNLLITQGKDLVNMNAGGGDDTLQIESNTIGNIDGGAGYDEIRMAVGSNTLDFSAIGSEGLSGIEEITFAGGAGTTQTLTLGIDDIFRLLQQSDDGTLTIGVDGGDATNKTLIIDDNGGINDTDPGLSEMGSLGFSPGSPLVDGGFHHFEFGAYTLSIDSNLIGASVTNFSNVDIA